MWAQQLIGPAMFQPVEVPAPAAGDLRPGEVLVAVEHGGITRDRRAVLRRALAELREFPQVADQLVTDVLPAADAGAAFTAACAPGEGRLKTVLTLR